MQTQTVEVSKETDFEYLTSVKIQFFSTMRNNFLFFKGNSCVVRGSVREKERFVRRFSIISRCFENSSRQNSREQQTRTILFNKMSFLL